MIKIFAGGYPQRAGSVRRAGAAEVAVRRVVQRRDAGQQHGGGGRGGAGPRHPGHPGPPPPGVRGGARHGTHQEPVPQVQ